MIAELLGARAVVLVSDHPGFGAAPVRVLSVRPGADEDDQRVGELLLDRAEWAAEGCPSTGALVAAPDLDSVLLLTPLPRGGRAAGAVVVAVPPAARPDGNDLAVLGALTNQLAGAVESSHRLALSQSALRAAAAARDAADAHARALGRRNALLKQARHELAGARERELVAEERQRIARDLHDSVAQHVLSMGMQVEWCRTSCDQPAVVERLTEVKALARSTVDRIRAAIFALSGGDDAPGLAACLRTLGVQHRSSGLELALDVDERAADGLPAALVRALAMVAQEALFNTVVHAEATWARVALDRQGDLLRMEVSDDGGGRAHQLERCLEAARCDGAEGYHRGLVNMEARVRQVGGDLSLHDRSGGGVLVRVTVPGLVPLPARPSVPVRRRARS